MLFSSGKVVYFFEYKYSQLHGLFTLKTLLFHYLFQPFARPIQKNRQKAINRRKAEFYRNGISYFHPIFYFYTRNLWNRK